MQNIPWNTISEILHNISKVLPDTDIWLGGPQVSFNAPEILQQFPAVTGIMIGEGEETFCELLKEYRRSEAEKEIKTVTKIGIEIETEVVTEDPDTEDPGMEESKAGKQSERDFSSVAGLCLRSGFTQARQTTDLSKLPFLYETTEPFQNRILYYESSRGCPYRCSYCLRPSIKK